MPEKKVMVLPGTKRRGNKAAKVKVKKLRVAAYCRVSTDSDEQATSYEAQVTHYKEYISQNPAWEFAGIYADDGISGTRVKKREEFQRMIDDCKKGKIDVIISKSISRFARNTIDCLNYIRQLKSMNIPVIFEKENINTMDSQGEVVLTIMASLAQQESESLSKNVKLGLQYRYQAGKVQVNHNWFLGYTKDKDGELVIDPEQAETVKRIYREYLEGKSAKAIAKGLMKDGIKNGAGHTKWWDTNIFQILTNEKYMGDALLQKTYTEDVLSKKRVANDGTVPQYYVEDSHDAIIPKKMFHEVQAEMARRGFTEDGQHRREGFCGKYALTGILICGECGAPYRRQTWTRNGKTQIVWRCRSRLTKNGLECNAPTLPEEKIQDAVVQAIREVYSKQRPTEIAIENIRSVVDGPETVELLETKLQELQQELVKRVNEHKDYEDLAEKIRNAKEERDRALSRRAMIDEREKQNRLMEEFFNEHRPEDLQYKDDYVRKLIEKIQVNPISLTIKFKSGTVIEIPL